MANELSGFDPDNFRTQIRNTMIMGLPQIVAQRPTFYKAGGQEWPTHYPGGQPITFDDDGQPLDPTVRPLPAAAVQGIQVACAVEFKATQDDNETVVGNFRDTAAILTLLDTEYALVKDCTQVKLGGNMQFYINYTAPPLGLGPVTVYQMYLSPTGEAVV